MLPSAQGSPVQQQEAACFSHPGPTADWWKVTAYHHQCPDLAPAATKVATSAINILENKCGIKYIRIDKSQLKLSPDKKNSGKYFLCYFINKKYNKAEKTLILSHGSIGEIAKSVLNEKYKVDFYTVPCIKETDELLQLCKPYKKILTMEEHSIVNGFYSFISSMLNRNKVFKEIDYIALEHEHSSLVGDQNFLRKKLKLNKNLVISKLSK